MNAADRAYRSLRGGILAGRYELGARLGEVETAETLEVSRTPVREALRRLSAEGLVELLPNRGARVATWTIPDIEEIYELRVCLESYGAVRAASRMTEESLSYLVKLTDEEEFTLTRADEDVEGVLTLNAEYHRAVMRYSGNQRLCDMVTPLIEVQSVLRTFRRYSQQHLMHHMNEHHVLNRAFQARDGEWAGSVMRAHLIGAKESLLEDKRRSEENARSALAD